MFEIWRKVVSPTRSGAARPSRSAETRSLYLVHGGAFRKGHRPGVRKQLAIWACNPPSDRATREKAESVRRRRKLARKQAIRDDLIAALPKKRMGSSTRPMG